MARRTRASKAAELSRLMNEGPKLSAEWEDFGHGTVSHAESVLMAAHFEARVKIWLNTWVKPLATDLVPELHQK